jgi:hypothetical protein
MKPDLRPILFAGGCLAASLAAAATPDFRARSYDFPVYTNAPIGRQISGQRAGTGRGAEEVHAARRVRDPDLRR